MDNDYTTYQEGLLNGKNTTKTYKGGYTVLSPDTESSFYQDSERGGLYQKFDDDTGFQNKPQPEKTTSAYQKIEVNDDSTKAKLQAEEEISPSMTQSVYNKNLISPNVSQPEMIIEKCTTCLSSVMISKEASKFKCCYCKIINDKTKKPTLQQRLFICGSCKQTISYVPISNYVRCICGTINYVPGVENKPGQVNVVPVNLNNMNKSQNINNQQNNIYLQQQQFYQQQQLQQQQIQQQQQQQQQQRQNEVLTLEQQQKIRGDVQRQREEQQKAALEQQRALEEQKRIMLEQQKAFQEQKAYEEQQKYYQEQQKAYFDQQKAFQEQQKKLQEQEQLEKLAIYQKQQEELKKKYFQQQQQQVSNYPVQYMGGNTQIVDNYQNNPYQVITNPQLMQQQQPIYPQQLQQFSMTQSLYGYKPNQN